MQKLRDQISAAGAAMRDNCSLYAKTLHHRKPAVLTLDFHPTGRHFLQIPGPRRYPTGSCEP